MSPRRRKATLLNETRETILQEITHDLYSKLGLRPGSSSLPVDFDADLKNILAETYLWNEKAKNGDATHVFQAFIVAPSSPWDPTTMEAFGNRSDSGYESDLRCATIASPVSFGLMSVPVRGLDRGARIEQKVKVLLPFLAPDLAPHKGSRVRRWLGRLNPLKRKT